MSLSVVILAAGKGKRMHGVVPKVLQPLAGKPLLQHVLDAAYALKPEEVIIVAGDNQAELQAAIADSNIAWAQQPTPMGTGDAVKHAFPHVSDASEQVLILYGDVPLVSAATLAKLVSRTAHNQMGILTANAPNPFGLGRIVRNDDDQVERIVEEKDASSAERAIHEINTGIFLCPRAPLGEWLSNLTCENAQREYYLTDIVQMAVEANVSITTVAESAFQRVQGVNNPYQLSTAERYYQFGLAKQLAQDGVKIIDCNRLDIRGDVVIEPGAEIDINCILVGDTRIARGAKIGAHCVIENCVIESNAIIEPFSHLSGATVESGAAVGPFARLRAGTHIGLDAKVGNFCELKKTELQAGAKASHLSYLGDAVIGANANIGAGTITCNYDGTHKHATHIGAGAFIGSGTQLVAPVSVGQSATVGANSTVLTDVADFQTVVTQTVKPRVLQTTVSDAVGNGQASQETV